MALLTGVAWLTISLFPSHRQQTASRRLSSTATGGVMTSPPDWHQDGERGCTKGADTFLCQALLRISRLPVLERGPGPALLCFDTVPAPSWDYQCAKVRHPALRHSIRHSFVVVRRCSKARVAVAVHTGRPPPKGEDATWDRHVTSDDDGDPKRRCGVASWEMPPSSWRGTSGSGFAHPHGRRVSGSGRRCPVN